MFNRGSEWGRWDLHVHTKGTAKNDQFGNITFDEYCIELFRRAIQNNIRAIGITDYFSIDNFKKVLYFQKEINNRTEFSSEEKLLISKIFILPNVELRTTPSTNEGSAINFHLIIDPTAIDEYEQRFTDHLIFTASGSEKYKLSRYDLAKLGRNVTGDATLEEEVAIRKGISSFVLNPSDIINAFNEYPSFRDHCIVAVANSNTDGASAFQGHERFLYNQEGATLKVLRESLYKVSDAIFSAIDTDFFLGKKATDQAAHIRLYGSFKPCIHGSDAHSLDKLFSPKGNRYCWIKAEPTFEGLKQILHEPESRVYIGPIKPELKNDYEVIDHITLKSDDVFNEVIYFNPNLTSIIGGRSSGKSTLLQCLAKKLQPTALDGDPSHINGLCQNLKIIWKDGKEDDSRQIEYFYQGHMYNKSKDEGIEEIVHKLLLQQKPDLFDVFEREKSASKLKIAGELSTYFSTKEQIEQKKNSLLSMGKIEDINAQIQALSEQINTYQTGDITEQELKNHDLQKKGIASIKSEVEQIDSLIGYLEKIQINEFVTIHNPFIDFRAYPIISKNVEQSISAIRNFAVAQLKALAEEAHMLLLQKRSNAVKACEEVQSDAQFIKVSQFLSHSENLKPILEQKQLEEAKAKRIAQMQDEIAHLEQSNTVLLTSVRNEWTSILDSYDNVIKEMDSLNVNQDLIITSSKVFEVDSYQTWIKGNINQQGEKPQNYTNRVVTSGQELLSLFDEITQSIADTSIKLKQGATLEKLTKEFFDNAWFKFKHDVIYDGDNYKAMSQGKKAFVVLKMTLECSDSKCPIIIDQPEDDLDNRAIFAELVKYLKEKKTQRQIILVTHNANVVVNADSELVIVANQHGSHSPNNHDKKFQYKYGSIECLLRDKDTNASTLDKKRIKDHICEILEGGNKAFKLRERKYNIA
ncbi:TrlF family AAA-like ATPase [Alkanindiges illinoisensis]|uniref:DNA repair protein n=1 Tax=Alkanindiges illinoisensis TaxID=197183 RepID=A0A4Y7XGC0_9GAMM|nr:hypothetical protein [Alkanindiges illinoisensis]TEU30298.1 hypothetical protein E2B99_02900 [Alkanindiges illinoisensis]